MLASLTCWLLDLNSIGLIWPRPEQSKIAVVCTEEKMTKPRVHEYIQTHNPQVIKSLLSLSRRAMNRLPGRRSVNLTYSQARSTCLVSTMIIVCMQLFCCNIYGGYECRPVRWKYYASHHSSLAHISTPFGRNIFGRRSHITAAYMKFETNWCIIIMRI